MRDLTAQNARSNTSAPWGFLPGANTLDPRKLGKYLASKILPEHPDGFSFEPFKWQLLGQCSPDIYVVSLFGLGEILEHQPAETDFCKWIAENLDALTQFGRHIGYWKESEFNLHYLDISILVSGRRRAEEVARVNRQKAIYCPFEDKAIKVTPATHLVAA